MSAISKPASPTTNPPKTAMSIIKDHDKSEEVFDDNSMENSTTSNISSFETQDKGCSSNIFRVSQNILTTRTAAMISIIERLQIRKIDCKQPITSSTLLR